MNVMELAKQAGFKRYQEQAPGIDGVVANWIDLEAFAALVAAQEREAIMKSIEELRPVENNPLLQNKPAAFWIQNFKQIVYARGTQKEKNNV